MRAEIAGVVRSANTKNSARCLNCAVTTPRASGGKVVGGTLWYERHTKVLDADALLFPFRLRAFHLLTAIHPSLLLSLSPFGIYAARGSELRSGTAD